MRDDARTRSRSPVRSLSPSRRRRDEDGDRDKERERRRERGQRHGEGGRDRGDRDRSHHHHSRRHHHHHHHHHQDGENSPPPPRLPFHRQPLTKTSLYLHTPLFKAYLSAVKGLSLSSLSETEAKGRWKSFIGKWNRGELDGEWYNHASLPPPPSPPSPPARESSPVVIHPPSFPPPSNEPNPHHINNHNNGPNSDSDSDSDNYGPTLPTPATSQKHDPHGPVIPTRDDLTTREEMLQAEKDNALDDHRHERKGFRKMHKEQLEELLPRADPGSRERKLEKKREVTEKLKGFGQEKEQGVEEVAERDLMGGDDALEELRRMKKLREERQNQRQSRREEEEMLRRQEREERVRVYKEREEKVMEGLRGLVRERFQGS
ncbi:hypothetical protein QBC41DRAFT_312537 [Cercophora samala]|uniref:Uncharacterized protein n=1 Tax=Cercophora samala TaxID=330535 RepID=A0AA39ZL21_9PEZI|nr:hypothetical protein QBC41DRAFT_312537 [Cercophora samala]